MSDAAIGRTGLGTMGTALALDIAEHGHRSAVHDRSPEGLAAAIARAACEEVAGAVVPCAELADLVAAIARPRAIIVMVPAGAAVGAAIEALSPLLDEGGAIIARATP